MKLIIIACILLWPFFTEQQNLNSLTRWETLDRSGRRTKKKSIKDSPLMSFKFLLTAQNFSSRLWRRCTLNIQKTLLYFYGSWYIAHLSIKHLIKWYFGFAIFSFCTIRFTLNGKAKAWRQRILCDRITCWKIGHIQCFLPSLPIPIWPPDNKKKIFVREPKWWQLCQEKHWKDKCLWICLHLMQESKKRDVLGTFELVWQRNIN